MFLVFRKQCVSIKYAITNDITITENMMLFVMYIIYI